MTLAPFWLAVLAVLPFGNFSSRVREAVCKSAPAARAVHMPWHVGGDLCTAWERGSAPILGGYGWAWAARRAALDLSKGHITDEVNKVLAVTGSR